MGKFAAGSVYCRSLFPRQERIARKFIVTIAAERPRRLLAPLSPERTATRADDGMTSRIRVQRLAGRFPKKRKVFVDFGHRLYENRSAIVRKDSPRLQRLMFRASLPAVLAGAVSAPMQKCLRACAVGSGSFVISVARNSVRDNMPKRHLAARPAALPLRNKIA
jgi:hypothetical protein